MAKKERCVIVGGGQAAGNLVFALRRSGWDGSITLLGQEPVLPYHRPPLSKSFLLNDQTADDLVMQPALRYEKAEVETRLGCSVTGIDRSSQSVRLSDGTSLPYDRLVLCTGSRMRQLTILGSELQGVHYLRTVADAEALKKRMRVGAKAVIVSGGYIGFEIASSFRQFGLEVVVLEAMERVLQRVTSEVTSEFFTRIHTEKGVQIHTSTQAESFSGDGGVQEVHCAGGISFPADLMVVGIGVLPNTELATHAGLPVEDGICMDTECRTEDERIWVCGDCCQAPSYRYARPVRLESVPNTLEQAKTVAASICGKPLDPQKQALPWFWSDQYEVKLQIAGLNHGYDDCLLRGDLLKGEGFSVWYFSAGELIAADCVDTPTDFASAKALITSCANVDPQSLADSSVDLQELVVKKKA